MMLAAVETVTKADPVWESRRHNSDVAAQATAGESVHAASPLKLDAPVARVGAPDVPMPFNDRLERAVIPSAERILAAVKGL